MHSNIKTIHYKYKELSVGDIFGLEELLQKDLPRCL
jgi:hypothetical protein